MRIGQSTLLLVVACSVGMGVSGCKKKKDQDKLCNDAFEGTWFKPPQPGTGDKAKFMEACKKAPSKAVECMDPDKIFNDDGCKNLMKDDKAWNAKMELNQLRDKAPVAGGGGEPPAGGGTVTPPPAGGGDKPAGGGEAAAGSDDEKFELFTVAGAVTAANPTEMPPAASKVMTKLGIADDKGVPDQAKLTDFNAKYAEWAKTHAEWIAEYMDPAKAKEFYDAHMK